MNDLRRNYGGSVAGTRGVAIDEGLRQYMLGVYNYMALGLAATALIAMTMVGNPPLLQAMSGPLKWLPFIGILGMGFLGPRLIFSGSPVVAHGAYWLYVALWGLLIGPWVALFVGAGLASEVYKAFFITASVFGAMSLWGYTTKRDLSGWAGFLGMACLGLLIAIVVNAFVGSTIASFVISSLVVVVISAVTAFETQMIKSLYQEGSAANGRASIFGAFALYGSFVTLFVHILNLLGIMRNN